MRNSQIIDTWYLFEGMACHFQCVNDHLSTWLQPLHQLMLGWIVVEPKEIVGLEGESELLDNPRAGDGTRTGSPSHG